jgi:hypothetical protein
VRCSESRESAVDRKSRSKGRADAIDPEQTLATPFWGICDHGTFCQHRRRRQKPRGRNGTILLLSRAKRGGAAPIHRRIRHSQNRSLLAQPTLRETRKSLGPARLTGDDARWAEKSAPELLRWPANECRRSPHEGKRVAEGMANTHRVKTGQRPPSARVSGPVPPGGRRRICRLAVGLKLLDSPVPVFVSPSVLSPLQLPQVVGPLTDASFENGSILSSIFVTCRALISHVFIP